jgi:predicted NBD/HSP70 family sugar kinase
VAGSDGIRHAMREAGIPAGTTIDAAAADARSGDETARTLFWQAGDALGYGLSYLVNLLDLELIVVRAGPAMLESDVYEQAATESFHEHGFHDVTHGCELRFRRRDQGLGARSAGSMVFEMLPDLPLSS